MTVRFFGITVFVLLEIMVVGASCVRNNGMMIFIVIVWSLSPFTYDYIL